MSKWIKCDERLPAYYRRCLCASYGTDFISIDDIEDVDYPERQEGESKKDYALRVVNAVVPKFAEIKKRPAYIEIGFLSNENGLEYWCDDSGFPMVVQPTFWKPLPIAPGGGNV